MDHVIDYYYSTRSIYAYFGAARIVAIARRASRRLVHKPVDLSRVDRTPLLAAALKPETQAIFAANTAKAIARKVLASPSYIIDVENFYGQDRLMMVERALEQPFRPSGGPA